MKALISSSDDWTLKPLNTNDEAWYMHRIEELLRYLGSLICKYRLDRKHGVDRYKPRDPGPFVWEIRKGTHYPYFLFLDEIIDKIKLAWADGGNLWLHPPIESRPPWIVG